MNSSFDRWIASLEMRHLADLRFSDVSRALRALSSTYVERRHRIGRGAALSGSGKRACFALFYGPLHYLVVREIVRALPGATATPPAIVDLGCGSGAAGVAWAEQCWSAPGSGGEGRSSREANVVAIDRHPWALEEAAYAYRAFGIRSRVRLGDIAAAPLPKGPAAFLAAFALNELPDAARETLLTRLVARATSGDKLLIVEPLARSATPWWQRWIPAVERAGGRADEWRFPVELPAIVAKLDRAAGLNHRELTARTLWIG